MPHLPNATAGLVVPVKPLRQGKSRLRGAADGGLGDVARHGELALALALDTLAAAAGARRVGAVVVVTSDPVVTEAAGSVRGVRVVPDGPPSPDGLNAALRLGAGHLDRSGPVGALQADLPALRPEELDAALETATGLFAAGAAGRVFCVDADGEGTTLLLAAPGVPLAPRFGPGSAAAHRASGALPLPGALPGLRRDVDTEADLRSAEALGLGPRTAAVLARRPVGARVRG